jgi:para-aminobenzoate synthetase
VRTLIIDNYDSFTWNIAHYIAEANGQEPLVVRNNEYSWAELQRMGPFDNIIISPGPGSVENDDDFGISREAIAASQVPLLGICLGHQGISHGNGGQIWHAPEPMHGRSSTVWHNGDPLFRHIPAPFQVVRYHSLVTASPLPPALRAIAFAEDGLIMGLSHRERPQWGVQFHPESILTEGGHQLIRNFRDITHERSGRAFVAMPHAEPIVASEPPPPASPAQIAKKVVWREVNTELSSEDLFVGLYGDRPEVFWLDSALVMDGLSRFSFMGEADEDTISCRLSPHEAGSLHGANALLDMLEQGLCNDVVGGDDLPFEFRGGWVGYCGYEMKAAFGGDAVHVGRYPDAVWCQANRFVAIDHAAQRVFLVAVTSEAALQGSQEWLTAMADRVTALKPAEPVQHPHSTVPLHFEWDQSRHDYLTRIEDCKNAIVDGTSYEICLTNQLTLRREVEGLALYRILRQTNPAPFAAYLRVQGIEILSASPERFVKVDASAWMEAKPIKGTCRRDPDAAKDAKMAEALRCSEKNRAENLMIVDLLRNDLGRVAERGSVKVPRLMYVESYSTVHQLLSTVTARMRSEFSLVDLLRAAFPGGSITGAPKIRTMQLIDELERGPRGVYCGSIGYLGHNRVADLNIGIRTIIVERDRVSFGVGGAITHLSDAKEEFDEITLKARALVRALSLYFHGEDVDYLNQIATISAEREVACTAG